MRVLAAGFDRHLSKPIDPTELMAAVQSLAAKRTPVE
jgi:CheY-like chemotaxis protein